MYYLIDYDRAEGKLISLQEFGDEQVEQARQTRLTLEIDLMDRRIVREVVLLEAASESDLRRTHRRYFEDVRDLAPETVPEES